MAHRRKSSHPVCKTRRQQGSNWEPQQPSEDDGEGLGEKSERSPDQGHEIPVSIETGPDGGPHIMIPPDLYKDFEAVRTQTKLDATDLMRRLLKDYQSISTSTDKQLTVHLQHEDTQDNEGEQNASEKAPIATDVSLATARVDTDDDEFQGLDLSVRSRKINSRLFDTKSLETGESGLDQPLDLTCSKPPVTSESLDRESPSSTQMEGVHSEFNYVYVYPGLYPPGSGLLPHDEMEDDSTKPVTSPVPELISPGRLSPPILTPRSTLMSHSDPLEKNFGLMNPGLAYNNFMNTMAKTALPKSISPTPRTNPNVNMGLKQEPGELFEPQRKVRISPNVSKTSHSTGHHEGKASKSKSRNTNEMTVISENMTYPGVYTSVMKLPWSRRTRTKTKKPKHKLKLEDTLIPQFMLDQVGQNESPVMPEDSEAIRAEIANPASSQSVMMVYPNATTTAYGRPIRRRGRPPKLPMLAKLLQHEQASKRSKKDKKPEQNEVQAQMTQQVQANGGMLVYNSGGQVVTAYAGAPPLPAATQQTTPTSTDTNQPQFQSISQLPPHMMPNMAQAQFLGQVSLSQLMGGPVQFLGQFPANAVPMPGQTIPGFPMTGQEHITVGNIDSEEGQTQNTEGMPQTPLQYAFQPIFVPSSMQPTIPIQEVATSSSETFSPEDTEMDFSEPKAEPLPDCFDNQIPMTEMNSKPVTDNSTHVMKHEHSNTISTMSTTSISNTESGAMYQEMILSSKSLVNVKKKKRQTAIQLLKAKSSDQNFLCTSFRIRPRLVAQAQAQRERTAIKESGDGVELGEIDTDSKNLNGPQNDMVHFGDNTQPIEEAGETDVVKVKRESDFDELYEAYGIDSTEIDIKQEVYTDDEAETDTYLDDIIASPRSNKRFMLKGSQKRKAKYGRKLIFTDKNGRSRSKTTNPTSEEIDESLSALLPPDDVSDRPDVGQELFNCKICNTVIPVYQIEEHSLDHVRKNRNAAKLKCKTCGGLCEKASRGSTNECNACRSLRDPLFNADNKVFSTRGHGKIACDECPETFKSLPDFYVHKIESHKDSDPKTLQQGEFECDLCGKVYQYFHALQFHRRTHRERKLPCLNKSCRQKFRSRRDMEAHFDRVHPDKNDYYHCVYEGCSKKFLKNFHLQEHIRVKHYNIKAFQCPWPGCVKEFAAQRHLKIHLLIHRDEKPMKCEHCDYRCRQRSAMNWHMRKHPDVPYKYKRSLKPPSVSAPESE